MRRAYPKENAAPAGTGNGENARSKNLSNDKYHVVADLAIENSPTEAVFWDWLYRILADIALSPAKKVVAVAIGAEIKFARFGINYRTISTMCAISRAGAIRGVRGLERAGYIRVIRVCGEENRYHLAIPGERMSRKAVP